MNVNNDGTVDADDIAAAQAVYQARSTDADWNVAGENGTSPAACDLNGDGVVDIEDLTLILLHFTAQPQN